MISVLLKVRSRTLETCSSLRDPLSNWRDEVHLDIPASSFHPLGPFHLVTAVEVPRIQSLQNSPRKFS